MSSHPIRNIHVKSEPMLIFVLASIQFTHILDFVIMMPLGSYFQESFHINPQEFSLLISAYTYSAFCAGIVGALLIDRFNRKSAAIFLYSGFMIGTAFCAIADSYIFLLIARIVSGSFGGILSSVIFAIVGDVIAMDRRGRAMGAIMGAFSVSSVIGIPLGLKVAEFYGWNMSFAGIVFLSLPILVLMYYHLPSIPPFQSTGEDPVKDFLRIFTYKRYMASYMLIMFVILGGFTVIPFIAPYMERNVGIPKENISWIYFFGGLVTFFSSRGVGIASDKIGKHKVFYILVPLSCIPIFIMTNLGQTTLVNVLILTTTFMVIVSGRWIPALALITSTTEPRDRGRFMTVISALQNLASGLGATIGGSILVAASPTAPYQNYDIAGYLAMGFNLIALILISKVKAVS
ncbi:MFS transporter [Leptospira kirschneri]|uniref:Transporter, major facilitator family protein n=1 Tax=Leptospira kirschneri str. 200802841 TaxID=1193047 RepID=A0A828XRQ8_9LEPT|nr:MFS transporter [Leptospira kirschneri]EKO49726.1 transporter, major facilitator family protein [Leptospira kirschneri str. 200802841]EKP06926.1 transporter, major facilitator family protein [Leptospira kirschneri str. 2008720114]EKQ85643.1 transporter, major facilitator family protein [Leptospira kirschneri serovar Grippotyphosa str. Moskva]EKR09230.1 transporter, major facilitator family protein [Leptospira kirschneri serovar Valbuzzi str. 200702274]EMK14251.1 transporter, major facilitat